MWSSVSKTTSSVFPATDLSFRVDGLVQPTRARTPPLTVAAFIAAVALAAGGCGGHASHGRLRVISLSIRATTGFPGPPSTNVTVDRGTTFARIALLVPLPLPAVASDPPSAKHPNPLTICFPMDLIIGLSNGEKVGYPSCYRPLSLRPVMAALCPLLNRPGFCAFYRNELAGHRREGRR